MTPIKRVFSGGGGCTVQCALSAFSWYAKMNICTESPSCKKYDSVTRVEVDVIVSTLLTFSNAEKYNIKMT